MSSRKRLACPTQHHLFNEKVSLLLPPLLAIDGKVLGSLVRQLADPAFREAGRLKPFSIWRANETTLESGKTLKIVLARRHPMPRIEHVLRSRCLRTYPIHR